MDILAASTDEKHLRKQQLKTINLIQLAVVLTVFMTAFIFQINMSTLIIGLSIISFGRGIMMLRHSKSTKRMIPVFEQAAVYDKEQLGDEYKKIKVFDAVMSFLLTGLILTRSFTLNTVDESFVSNLPMLIVITLIAVAAVNLGEMTSYRKVDSPDSEEDIFPFMQNTLSYEKIINSLRVILVIGVVLLI